MIESKLGQRLVGVVDLVVSAGLLAWVWRRALTVGEYNPWAAGVLPILLVVGLGLILVPIDVARHRARHGTDRPATFGELPPAWKVLMPLSLAAGIGNWVALLALVGG